jgi:hypothetical protein
MAQQALRAGAPQTLTMLTVLTLAKSDRGLRVIRQHCVRPEGHAPNLPYQAYADYGFRYEDHAQHRRHRVSKLSLNWVRPQELPTDNL